MTRTTNELLKTAVVTSAGHLLKAENCAAVLLRLPDGQIILAGDKEAVVHQLRQDIEETGSDELREAIRAFGITGAERFWMKRAESGLPGPISINKPAADYPDAERYEQFECKRVEADQ